MATEEAFFIIEYEDVYQLQDTVGGMYCTVPKDTDFANQLVQDLKTRYSAIQMTWQEWENRDNG